MTELAKTYADALFALAAEENREELYLHELDVVCKILADEPEYVRLMENRAIAKDERLKLMDDAFAGKVDAYLLSFMKILCERGAFAKLSECREAYESAYNEKHHIAVARVVSAVPMSDEQIARLKEALEAKTGKTIKLSVRVDPQLGGGLCVEMEGQRYDNTVLTKMDRLRKVLLSQS